MTASSSAACVSTLLNAGRSLRMSPLPDAAPLPIVNPERRRWLEGARRALVTAIAVGHVPDLYTLPLKVRRRCGVFVTLRSGRRLRGCIGQPDSPHPLE